VRRQSPRQLQNLRPWPKGVSGNPAGMPRHNPSLRELARSYTKDAVNTLVSIMRSAPKPADRIEAANILLSRGWGLPTQPIAAEGEIMIAASEFERARATVEAKLAAYASRDDFPSPPPALPPGRGTLDEKLARLFDDVPDNGGPAT
jgi:hypothetical protein